MSSSADPWVKLRCSFPRHPKVVTLSDKAFRLHVCALAHAGEHLTDGEIDQRTLRFIAAFSNVSRPGRVVEELVSARLWERNPLETDAFLIHGYKEHQRSKADVEREREAARDRMARLRSAERSQELFGNGSPEVRPHVRQQRREDLYKESLRPKGPSSTTTNVVERARTYLETVGVHFPDEDAVRDELTSRFHLGDEGLDQGIELWRQLRAEAQGSASS